jgi:hypothetical protein
MDSVSIASYYIITITLLNLSYKIHPNGPALHIIQLATQLPRGPAIPASDALMAPVTQRNQ